MSKQTEALKLALEALLGWGKGFPDNWGDLDTEAVTAIREALAEQPAQPAKLKVTLEDRPIDIELAQYKRMFEAACSALGQIGDALGCDPEEGGAEPILAAIAELKAEQPAQQQEPDRVKFERHWRKTRGGKKANRELPRHPLQPQTYIQDSANRHWVTWQAAVRSVSSPSPCPTCEALARTVMLDQTYHDAQRKPFVGLTDAERETLRSEADEADAGYRELIKATEAKLRKKNS